MSAGRFVVEGELYLALSVVAELYAVDHARLERFAALGLVPVRRVRGEVLCIAAVHLDRVAAVVRYQTLGCDAEAIALVLGADPWE